MRRTIIPLLIAAFVLVACGSAKTVEVTKIVEKPVTVIVTQVVERVVTKEVEKIVTKEVEVTRIVTVPVTVPVTVVVTATPTPTPKPSPTPAQENAAIVKLDNLNLEQDRGGVILRVHGVAIARWDDMPAEFKDAASIFTYWDGVKYVGILSVEVENTTDKTINVFADQGIVVVGQEQVDTDLWTSEDVGGEFLAGVRRKGLILFGLKEEHNFDEIDSIRYVVDAPIDDNFNPLADADYDFQIPLH